MDRSRSRSWPKRPKNRTGLDFQALLGIGQYHFPATAFGFVNSASDVICQVCSATFAKPFCFFNSSAYSLEYFDDLRLRVLRNKHDHILSGHPGQNKTTELILRDYTWPGLREFVKTYCKSCTTCMCAKPQRHKPYGLLKQLPVPERPWNSISMDFIEPLPASSGCDSILVIVDRLTKQSIFILTTIHCTSEDLAMLLVIHVFSKHGVPEHVTSDRGSEFVSRFFHSLGKALD